MKYLPLLAGALFLSVNHDVSARGGGGVGGGFHEGGGDFGGGFRDEARPDENFGDGMQVDRTSQDNFQVEDSKEIVQK